MNVQRQYIECQTCGRAIRELTEREVPIVAADPMNFIIDCTNCIIDRKLDNEPN